MVLLINELFDFDDHACKSLYTPLEPDFEACSSFPENTHKYFFNFGQKRSLLLPELPLHVIEVNFENPKFRFTLTEYLINESHHPLKVTISRDKNMQLIHQFRVV